MVVITLRVMSHLAAASRKIRRGGMTTIDALQEYD